MDWDAKAEEQAREILEKNTQELFGEAERIARRLKAGAVSAEYVSEAAFSIGIRRPSALGDLLLTIAFALLGLAGGVLVVVVTATTTLPLKGWVDPTSIAIACLGFLMAGVGGTLKIINS